MTTSSSSQVLPPPIERYTILGWLYKNLFSTWYNAILTFVALGIAFAVINPVVTWSFGEARWAVISENLRLFNIGRYPIEHVWRVWTSLFLLILGAGIAWGVWLKGRTGLGLAFLAVPVLMALLPFAPEDRYRILGLDLAALIGYGLARWQSKPFRRVVIYYWILFFPVVVMILYGFTGEEGFWPQVPPMEWGGLMLTILLAAIGIVLSFPIGVGLALGRQSDLPIIKYISIFMIEVVRGVPLVTILFMMNQMLPLFLPAGVRPDHVLRAVVGITFFSAAYMAENIRGGLQSIPRGQYEAAHALGLSAFQSMAFIVLPQALRAVIPILVSQFIGLLKDTTLVMIIGLFDILGIAKVVVANPEWIGTQRETLLYVAAIFWILSYSMSYASRRLEIALGLGER